MALLALALAVTLATAVAASAQATSALGISLTPSTSRPYWACPHGPCEAIIDPPPVEVKSRAGQVAAPVRFALPASGPLLQGSGEKGGYDPQDLQSAYAIPTSTGSGQTIALVTAFGFPDAEKDLATYRKRYGLTPCTTADGCFRKVNQNGEEGNYPSTEIDWEAESALDIEMASAACPACHILLIEATNAGSDLAQSVDTAARLGATEISNSWGRPEQSCGVGGCEEENADLDQPGVLITAAGGDRGYDDAGLGAHSPEFPASSPYVVAVGGTRLRKAENARGWSEEVWFEESTGAGSGSGCSTFPKPLWQSDAGCAGRMTNDVAAVASCESPVSVYNPHGWQNMCGTSVSTPVVAGIEAHASAYSRSLPGAEAFYQDPGALYDVTTGDNGQCTPPALDEYFCHAELGYDGPTGNGTPHGALALTGAGPTVASVQPDTGPTSGGTSVTIVGSEFSAGASVQFGGVGASEVEVSSTDEIIAVSPPGAGTVDVTVGTPEGASPVNPQDRFTYQEAPTVVTGAASAVGRTAATLNATVDPNGEPVSSCVFEYGESPTYGSSVACSTAPGSGTDPVPVSAQVTGLSPDATYYFRAVATNADGIGYGAQQSFAPNLLPELGRCVKLTGAATGVYSTAACTTKSRAQDSGRYEWQPGPAADNRFSLSSSGAVLEIMFAREPVSKALECGDSRLAGEYTGVQTASLSLTLSGCSYPALKSECKSTGATAGEIVAGPIEAQLGVIKAGATPSIGWALNPGGQSSLATYDCGSGRPFSITGSVIAQVTAVDKMSSAFTVKFDGAKDVQSPQAFEGATKDTLSLVSPIFLVQEIPTTLTLSGSLENAEPIEIKAAP